MDLTAVIFVLLAVAWAVYLIPKALKHHDEVARTRSIDEFSPSMRVLASREPVGGRDPRLVVPTTRTAPSASPAPEVEPSAPAAPVADPRSAARVAARRRRRILAVLLLATVGTSVAASFAYVEWWAAAIPGGLVVAFLVLCRVLVRRETRRDVRREDRTAVATGAPVIPEQSSAPRIEQQRPVDEHRVARFDDHEDTVDIPVAMLQAAATATSMPAAEQAGSSLWDPLPVTLPTYVTAPRARRTVRTIDLGEPGTWTSGRTDEDSRIAAAAADAQAATDASTGTYDTPPQRAVGD